MADYRLSPSARTDIIEALAWSRRQFGEQAGNRYETLLAAAIRDIAGDPNRVGSRARPELGHGARTWHLRLSRTHVVGDEVRRPRHLLLYRTEAGVMVIGRVLHDAMDLPSHVEPDPLPDE